MPTHEAATQYVPYHVYMIVLIFTLSFLSIEVRAPTQNAEDTTVAEAAEM